MQLVRSIGLFNKEVSMKKSKTLNAVLKELKKIKKLATDLDLDSMNLNGHGKLMEYVVRMNETTEHNYFMHFSGHVDSFDINVHVGGYIEGKDYYTNYFNISHVYARYLKGDWVNDIISMINYGIWLYEEKGILFKYEPSVYNCHDYEQLKRYEEHKMKREAEKLTEVEV